MIKNIKGKKKREREIQRRIKRDKDIYIYMHDEEI